MHCFVIRGFGEKTDSWGQKIDFDKVDEALIAPVLKACRLDRNTTALSPKANSISERVIRTIRRESLDWIIPLSEGHLHLILPEWVDYNGGRPHSALGPGVPGPPAGCMCAGPLRARGRPRPTFGYNSESTAGVAPARRMRCRPRTKSCGVARCPAGADLRGHLHIFWGMPTSRFGIRSSIGTAGGAWSRADGLALAA